MAVASQVVLGTPVNLIYITSRFSFSSYSYVKQSSYLFVNHLGLQMILGIDVTVEV